MTATPTPTAPRNVAAEFAALMAEQADFTRRCFDVLATAFREQSADHAQVLARIEAFEREASRQRLVLDTEPRPAPAMSNSMTIEARGTPAEYEPEPAKPAAVPQARPPKTDPAPPAPDTKSPRDLVLDLYAATTLDFGKMAAQLGMVQAKVAGTVAGCRRGNDPRVLAGDAAREKLRAIKAAGLTPKPEDVGKLAAALTGTAAPQLAPAPRAPSRPAPKAAAPVEPLPPVKTPAEAKARADARAQVLRHYGETGDYEGQIAQKLGYLRAWVVAFITEARAERDPRVTVGDSRRRTRERAH